MRYLQADADVWLEPTNTQDATHNLLFADSVDGHEKVRTDTGLTYNPNTQVLTTTTFTGALQGNAATATSATSSSTSTTATTATNVVTVGNNSTNEDNPIVFAADASTGNQSSIGLETDSSFLFNPSTNAVTATTFIGALQGNATSANSASTATSAGSATTATTATNIVLTANTSTNENNSVLFAADAASSGSSIGIEADHAELYYNPGTELLTAKRLQLTSTDATNVAMLIPNDAYIGSVGDPDAIRIAADGTVTVPHLNVSGDTTTISTTHMTVEDHLIELNHGQTGSPSEDAGFIFERGDSTNVAMVWNEQSDRFEFAETDSTGATTGYINMTGHADIFAKSFATTNWKIPQTSPSTNLGSYQYLRVPLNFNAGGTLEWGAVAVGLNELTEVKYNITDFSHSLKIGDTTTGSLSSASNNFIVGQGAANGITSGDENIIIGHDAANNLSTSSSNIILGHEAAKYIGSNGNPGINGNILIGVKSGENLNVGNAANNIAIGEYALSNRTSSSTTNNVAIGTNAGKGTSTASSIDSIFIGNNAAATMTNSGSTLIAVGAEAGMVLQGNTGASSNILIGYQAGRDATFSDQTTKNIMIGDNAGRNFRGTTGNIAIGEKAFSQVQDANHSHNIAIGYETLYNSDTNIREQNVALGYQAGKGTTGSQEEYGIYIGSQAGESINSGDYNTLIGYYAGQTVTIGYDNVLIGKNAGNAITSGHNNIVIGEYGGTSNMSGEIHLYADGNKRISVDSSGAVQFNNAYTFPTSDGTANQILQTNGSGALSFATSTAIVTGLNNQTADRLVTIGSTTTELDGEANLTFNGSTLTVTGNANIGGNGSTGGVTVQDGAVQIRTSSGNVAYLDFYCESNNAHKVTIKSPPHSDYTGDVTFQLPPSNGTNGQVLQTNGSGVTTWVNAGGSTAADDITTGDAAVTLATSSGDITIDAQGNNTDIHFKGNDNSSSITALTLDMSNKGNARFFSDVDASSSSTGAVVIDGGIGVAKDAYFADDVFIGDNTLWTSDSALLYFGANIEVTLKHVHDTGLLLTESTNSIPTIQLTDANESISSDGTNLRLTSGGTTFKVPTSDGTANQVLQTDGGGNLSFATVSGGGGASALNDLSDVEFDITDFSNSLMIGDTHTGTLNGASSNTFVGFLCGRPITSGDDNSALGKGAFLNLTSGSRNTAVGKESLPNLNLGDDNTAVGNQALNSVDGEDYNVAVGSKAGYRQHADGSTYIGYEAGRDIYTGTKNTFVGYQTGYGATYPTATGDYNTALGAESLDLLSTGDGNICIGYQTGDNITSADYNTIIGHQLDPDSATAGGEIVIGTNTRRIHVDNSGGVQFNSAFRFPTADGTSNQVLQTNGSGAVSWATVSGGGGASALNDLSDVKFNGTDFVGSLKIGDVTTGTLNAADDNTIIGVGAANAITSADHNVVIGHDAHALMETSYGSVAIGDGCVSVSKFLNSHVTIGSGSTYGGGTADVVQYGVHIGASAGNGGGNRDNVYIGYKAGMVSTKDNNSYNVGIGTKALMNGANATNRAYNTAIGFEAGVGAANDAQEEYGVYVGYQAGTAITTGDNNIFIGKTAGDAVTTGANNIIIGDYAGTAAMDNEIHIYNNTTERLKIDSSGAMRINNAFTLPAADGTANQVLQTDGSGAITFADVAAGSTTIQDEGVTLSTAATTLNFVGAGVAASGTGSTKTITIAGGGGGGGITTGKAIAMAMVFG